MKNLVKIIISDKSKTIPILSFPAIKLINCTVYELVTDSEKQAQGMRCIAEKCAVGASLNMMDLSVESEAFGSEIKFDACEIPSVIKGILTTLDDVENVNIPEVGKGRTGIYITGVKKAKEIVNKPVFCGVIGPFSLACRLYDMTELMMACFDEPTKVHMLLSKCSQFIASYIKAFKAVGADGVIMAEPAAGLLSPDFCAEYSSAYVKEIKRKTEAENFVFVYHNCGNVVQLKDSLIDIDADIYHFGNAIDIENMLKVMPKDKIIMGNINPVYFKNNDRYFIYNETYALLKKCDGYENFMISSGCDIPADSSWESITGFFDAINDFYKNKQKT